jgi:hypothetical protein
MNQISSWKIESGFLQGVTPWGESVQIPMDQNLRFFLSIWSGRHWWRGNEGKFCLEWLPENDRKDFARKIFSAWAATAPDQAKKAAFDYKDSGRGMRGIAMAFTLLFCWPIATAFVADSFGQFRCTAELKQGGVLAQMEVTKFKRKRRGHYILDLAFTAPNGMVITGRDQLITQEEASIPKSVPVVYSQRDPSCWSLTPNLQGSEVNWAKRKFFGTFTGLLGLSFFVIGFVSLAWGFLHFRRKRPYAKDLTEQFGLIC